MEGRGGGRGTRRWEITVDVEVVGQARSWGVDGSGLRLTGFCLGTGVALWGRL